MFGLIARKVAAVKLDLPYLSEDVDRHGNVLLYVWRNGKRMRMKFLPTAGGFMEEYSAALAKLEANAKIPKAGSSIGTMGWLVNEFEHSHHFLRIDEREQRVRRQIVEATLNEETKASSGKRFRDRPIAVLTADHVRLLRDRKRETPASANHRVTNLRVILSWGMEERSACVQRNVAREVRLLKYDI